MALMTPVFDAWKTADPKNLPLYNAYLEELAKARK
jgi:hypothetical protein